MMTLIENMDCQIMNKYGIGSPEYSNFFFLRKALSDNLPRLCVMFALIMSGHQHDVAAMNNAQKFMDIIAPIEGANINYYEHHDESPDDPFPYSDEE